MTTARNSSTDAEGRCARHPFVQLRCRSQRTGDWRILLESCPLCAADDRSVGTSVCSGTGASVAGGAPAARTGRERTTSPVSRPSRGRSAGRVRFPAAGKMVRRLTASLPPPPQAAAPKALKEPKYKECKHEMQRQLDESEKQQVTFMSEDLSLSMSGFWNSMGLEDASDEGDDDSVLSGHQDDNDRHSTRSDKYDHEEEEELTRMLSVDHEEEKKRADEELARKMEKKLRNSLQLHQSRAQMPLPEEYAAAERSDSDHSGGSRQHERKAGRGGMARMPLPQDFEREERRGDRGGRRPRSSADSHAPPRSPSRDSSRDASRSLGSAHSKASGRSRSRSSSRQPPGGAPSRRGHSLRPSATAPAPAGPSRGPWPGGASRVGPDPEEFPCSGRSSQRSPSQDSYRSAPGRGPPPPPAPPRGPLPAYPAMTLQAFQRLPLEATPGGGRQPPQCQEPSPPNHTGMVVTPGCVDEVSVLSFLCTSATASKDSISGSGHRLEEDPQEEEEDDEKGEEMSAINTADCDSKGRCVHHPHIRLRKKKMFGRGWKTLMSACPDCCVGELQRIRMVDEKKRKMARKKLERANKNQCAEAPTSSGTIRSAGSAPVGAYDNVGATSGPHRPASVPLPEPVAHPRCSPSQESFRPAPVPTRAAAPGSQGQRSPSQDSYRSAPVSRRLPSQESFRNGSSASGVNGNVRRPPPAVPTAPPRSQGKRSPSQESFRNGSSASGVNGNMQRPPPAVPTAPPRSQGKRSPSQDSYRLAPAPRRSPSQDSFRNVSSAGNTNGNARRPPSPAPKKAPQTTPSVGSTSTANLTESERQFSGSDRSGAVSGGPGPPTDIIPFQADEERVNVSLHRNKLAPAPHLVPEKKTRSKSSSSSSRPHKSGDRSRPTRSGSAQEPPQLGTIHVRQMQWTDAKGNSGRYTGQVNPQFLPLGNGSMVYDISNKTKEGKWKNGKCRRSSSAGENGHKDGQPPAPRSRSRSKATEGRRRSKSRDRSASQAGARQRSVSRQPQTAIAVFS